ncbi:MAG: phosphatidylserine decarboxylase family protein [Saprospiraceae bacterium]|nr:phosphatidylserine decarboxylase family protein [Bacteroidia bacterium]NNE16299.1 phosphatidylserine decarboxylase family protein [Saprospiraceae bacterium]NNL93336.1 phosphatidylserine decarboxylase family protein [Saprospiraceae bacterium]
MRFHKQGYPTLLVTLIFSAVIIFAAKQFGPHWLYVIAMGLSLFLLIVVLQFFRDPFRKKPTSDDNKVYTPADGKVVVIEKTMETEYIKEECWQVSVFMSPLNVHINRNPVNGIVAYLKYHAGKYLVAWHPKSSTENERFTTVYKTKHGNILIRQIAGALARRIVNDLKENESVKQSEEMGFIKFGSRVDIFLPLSANIEVELNQMVKSPTDLIATFNS